VRRTVVVTFDNVDAVVTILPLGRDATGRFAFAADAE